MTLHYITLHYTALIQYNILHYIHILHMHTYSAVIKHASMYVCMHACMYVHMCIYDCIHACIHLCEQMQGLTETPTTTTLALVQPPTPNKRPASAWGTEGASERSGGRPDRQFTVALAWPGSSRASPKALNLGGRRFLQGSFWFLQEGIWIRAYGASRG